MDLPHTFPKFYPQPLAFRHDGGCLFTGKEIAIGCEVAQARNLALRIYTIDTVKFHAAPRFSTCEGHRKQSPAGTKNNPTAM
jgi:hypothetical protein